MLEVTSDDTPDGHAGGHSVLLARRHRYTGTLSCYRCRVTRAGPAVQADRRRIGQMADRKKITSSASRPHAAWTPDR